MGIDGFDAFAPETLRELDELEQLIGSTCADLLQVLGSVHRLRAKGAAFRAVEPPALPMALAFAEEYTSAVIDEQLAELAALIERVPALRNGRGTVTRLRVHLGHVIEQVNRRRLDQGFSQFETWRDQVLEAEELEAEAVLRQDHDREAEVDRERRAMRSLRSGDAGTNGVRPTLVNGGRTTP